MTWLQKISQLAADWWKQAQHHFDQVIKNTLKPIPSDVGLQYGDREPVYIPNHYNAHIMGFNFFSKNTITFNISLWANYSRYDCRAILTFDTSVEHQLKYNERAKSHVYHTNSVDGLPQLQGNLIGVTCDVEKQTYDRTNPTKVRTIKKQLNGADLLPQEATPFNIIQTFRDLIISDFDSDGNAELPISPIAPSTKMPGGNLLTV